MIWLGSLTKRIMLAPMFRFPWKSLMLPMHLTYFPSLRASPESAALCSPGGATSTGYRRSERGAGGP